MTKNFLEKLASAPQISHWGLPAHKRFPLDTVEHVKTAQERFPDMYADVSLRLELAKNIVKRASELSTSVDPGIKQMASGVMNPDFYAHIEMRKQASCHMRDAELDALRDMARDNFNKPEVLEKVAAVLQTFDKVHALEKVADPVEVVFGAKKEIFEAKTFKFRMDMSKLASLDGKVDPSVIKQLQDGKPVHELPLGLRELVAGLLNAP